MPRRKTAPPHGWIDRETGQLYAVLNYTDPKTGKRKQKYRKARDTTHVNELYAEMSKKLANEGPAALDNHKKTFTYLTTFYTDNYVKPVVYVGGRKRTGFRRKLSDVKNEIRVLNERFGKVKLRAITFDEIRDFRDRLYTTTTRRKDADGNHTHPAVSTVNHYMKRLRRMLTIALRKGWIDTNPFYGDEALITSDEVERTRRLLPGEEESLLSWCVDTTKKDSDRIRRRAYMRPIVIAAIDTAARKGELLYTLKKPQVDFARNVIWLGKGGQKTKTETARPVPLTPRLRAELEILFEQTKDDPEGPVFDVKDVKKAFRAICEDAKVEGLTFHDLRHEGTFRILEACGGNHVKAMKITGHEQLKTFMRYVNVDIESVQQVAENLALWNIKPDQREDDRVN